MEQLTNPPLCPGILTSCTSQIPTTAPRKYTPSATICIVACAFIAHRPGTTRTRIEPQGRSTTMAMAASPPWMARAFMAVFELKGVPYLVGLLEPDPDPDPDPELEPDPEPEPEPEPKSGPKAPSKGSPLPGGKGGLSVGWAWVTEAGRDVRHGAGRVWVRGGGIPSIASATSLTLIVTVIEPTWTRSDRVDQPQVLK